MSRKRKISVGLAIAVLILSWVAIPRIVTTLALARAGTAYIAKALCSGVLMGGMEPERLLDQELVVGRSIVKPEVLEAEGEVTASALFGFISARAKRQGNLGCSLYHKENPPAAIGGVSRPAPTDPKPSNQPWSIAPFASSRPPEGIDDKALRAAIDNAFLEPDPNEPRRTRAVIVVLDGWVVAERYAEGINHTTVMTGWSMTKSLMHGIVGIAVSDGILTLNQSVPVPEWSDPEDPRRFITLDQLLRMSSGLAFDEMYDDFTSDAVVMLMLSWDAAAVAAEKPMVSDPGAAWFYSSGTTNLISRTLRLSMDNDEAYWQYPYDRLFGPIGMHSAVIETDPSGTFVGSSFGYATARDWARFGLLYLSDGLWGEKRVLPEGWVEYGITPTPGADQQQYGAHWWLNAGGRLEGVPKDEYRAQGFEGQYLMVIPSRRTVIVRLGQTPGSGFDSAGFEHSILKALPG